MPKGMTPQDRLKEIDDKLSHKVAMRVTGRESHVWGLLDTDVDWLISRICTLEKAFEEILVEVGTSTKSNKIARKALAGEE